ncbi:MAG: C2H2-type zinc finger protein [Actinobacteria bacterium]|nr:C2H2-type zinc finger protein [Actinomycetota bacterium]
MALTCPACGGEFETQEKLDEHTRTEHGGSFRCPACGAEFETQEKLDEHVRTEHPA